MLLCVHGVVMINAGWLGGGGTVAHVCMYLPTYVGS